MKFAVCIVQEKLGKYVEHIVVAYRNSEDFTQAMSVIVNGVVCGYLTVAQATLRWMQVKVACEKKEVNTHLLTKYAQYNIR